MTRIRELTERRAKEAKHFLNDDGTNTAEFSVGSRHYQAAAGGPWLDKKQQFRAGPGAAEWISGESDVTMRTYQTGTGGSRRWWVEFKERITGKGIAFELNVQPTVTAGSKVLTFAGGWTYTHTRAGGKMYSPPIATAEGPKSYTFIYALIGGADPLTLEADGSIRCGDIFRMAAPFLEGANGKSYPASSWTLDSVAKTLSFSYTDATLPAAAYPYRVDPSTTFNIAVGGDDAHLGTSGATYGAIASYIINSIATEFATARELTATPSYVTLNSLARWDTSSLPDTVGVSEVRVRGYVTILNNVDLRSVTADAHTGWSGGNPATSSFSFEAQTGALAGKPLSEFTVDALNDIVMDNVAGASLTGYTSYRFHISGGQPTGLNRLAFASYEHTTLAEPQLLITYVPDIIPPANPTGLTATVVTVTD